MRSSSRDTRVVDDRRVPIGRRLDDLGEGLREEHALPRDGEVLEPRAVFAAGRDEVHGVRREQQRKDHHVRRRVCAGGVVTEHPLVDAEHARGRCAVWHARGWLARHERRQRAGGAHEHERENRASP